MSEEIECIGICEADESGAYCTGCGRPWDGGENPPEASQTPEDSMIAIDRGTDASCN